MSIDNFEGERVDPEQLSTEELLRIKGEYLDSLDRHYYFDAANKAILESDLAEIEDVLAWRTYGDNLEVVS